MAKVRTFVLSWDQLGLEACIDASEIEKRRVEEEKQDMWNTLQDKSTVNRGREASLGSIVSMLTLRAKFNHQRHYEIYSVNTDWSITEKDMRSMFECDPQGSADLIRLRGKKLYSDRATDKGVVIR